MEGQNRQEGIFGENIMIQNFKYTDKEMEELIQSMVILVDTSMTHTN